MDLSYRFVEGVRKIRQHLQAGDIGTVYAVDLVFHNAYGPDKAWYYQPQAAGGRDAVIEVVFHGTAGGLALRNMDGYIFCLQAKAKSSG